MKINDKYKYALPPIITAVMLCIIYAIKHIYPFGNVTVDFYDLSNQIVTYYCHVYDALHGDKSLFYDVYTALGTSMVGTCGSSNISIFNLFFLFIKRENILPLMSVFLMIKMMAASLSMFVFLEKVTHSPIAYKVMLSVCYAFSGFILTTYTIMEWQDIVAYFPLIMLGLHMLIKEGKYGLYTFMLSVSLIAGYYISFLIIIFIFLLVGFMVTINRIQKNNKNLHILKLLICTVTSIMISAFIVLPQLMQTMNSARLQNSSETSLLGTYFELLSNVKLAYTSRWFIFANATLAAAVIFSCIIKTRDKKIIIYAAFTAVALGLEFLVESINLIWHYGSYVHYPMRNGFIVTFCLITLASIGLERLYENTENADGKYTFSEILICIVFAVTLCAIFCYFCTRTGLVLRTVFHIFVAYMVVAFACYTFVLLYKNGKLAPYTSIILFVEIMFMAYIFIGKPAYTTGYTEEPEMESDYYYVSNELRKSFPELENAVPYVRVKNPDESLNSNYGLVLKNSVLSNWTALLSPMVQRDATKLGYSVQYTRVLDSGGTVFSDALLGVEYVVSCIPMDEELYTLIGEKEITNRFMSGGKTYYLYECKYKLPFGIITDSVDYDFENSDICEVYNRIYKSISHDNENIAEYLVNCDDVDSKALTYSKCILTQEGIEYADTMALSGKKALYYLSNQIDTDDYNTSISVNGKQIWVPSISETDNSLYPAHFNNNALYLGTYTDEDVSVDIDFEYYGKNGNQIESEFEPRVVAIDLGKLERLTNGYEDLATAKSFDYERSEYSFTINDNSDKKYLVLPISYDEGYSATLNGNKTEIIHVGGLFTAVPLESGKNEITVSFFPSGMKTGIVISALGLLILAIFIIVGRKSDILDCEYLWLNNLYIVAFAVVVLIMYVVPVLFVPLVFLHIV